MNRMYSKGNFVESCFLNFNKHKQFYVLPFFLKYTYCNYIMRPIFVF